ncbi:MAG: methyltransferase domain-containing protein [Desulfobacterales bacterium]|nr:MAG: methyltransferase domain-containing protein [Desulfobacterales bacterium]
MANTHRITSESKVDLIFHLKWKSGAAIHTDGYQARQVNIWRDLLPPVLLEALMNKGAGDRLQVPLKDGEIVAAFTPQSLLDVQSAQFNRRFRPGTVTEPRLGRFYPKGMLEGITGIFRSNVQPFRCVGVGNGRLTVDFNHPLAGKELDLAVVIGKVKPTGVERGGTSNDWMETLTSGAGMQARWQGQPTDYFSDDTFRRDDDQPDAEFYQKPRYVHHIDDTAREMVRNTYGRFLTDGMQVLDLMSSWQSHIPTHLHLDRLVGLGLNADELQRNSQLNEFLVHDLNAESTLPFDANMFDAVINTASVEYLVDPLVVFKEVHRILRPDGFFIVTFSNRWFPTKAIKIWQELHEFERMGLVLEYFLRAGGFDDLQTYSIRGLPRPRHDQYFPQLSFSDPVYAVWGRKK